VPKALSRNLFRSNHPGTASQRNKVKGGLAQIDPDRLNLMAMILRLAFCHYGLSDLDAYELLSKVARIHLDEMVDPNYVVVASIEKKYLPPKKKP
jgi:hypothetical protein